MFVFLTSTYRGNPSRHLMEERETRDIRKYGGYTINGLKWNILTTVLEKTGICILTFSRLWSFSIELYKHHG